VLTYLGNAKILNSTTNDDLLQSTNMTTYEYTIALMVFLIAYSVFEAPSNLALKVFSPNKYGFLSFSLTVTYIHYSYDSDVYSRWLGFLVVTFGAFCAGLGGSKNFASVSAIRFFLGAAESGVFPGMIFYLSFWYKPEERATRISGFLCSATLAGAFGG
jgi:MFS family permease